MHFRFSRFSHFLLDPESGEGTSTTTEAAPAGSPPDLTKAIEGMLKRHAGDNAAVLRELIQDNYKYREEIRVLTGKLPAEGAVILKGEDAKAWEAYRALGKPDDVKRFKAERDQFATENSTFKRNEELAGVAEAAGVKLAVLRQIAGDRVFERKTVKDPKTQKDVEQVLVKDGEAEPVPFADYAAAHWKDFLPALRPDAKPAATGTPNFGAATPPPPPPIQIPEPRRPRVTL